MVMQFFFEGGGGGGGKQGGILVYAKMVKLGKENAFTKQVFSQ